MHRCADVQLFHSLIQFAGDKRGKFSWRGTKDFLYTLGNIQVGVC